MLADEGTENLKSKQQRRSKAQQPGLFRIWASNFVDSVGDFVFKRNCSVLALARCRRRDNRLQKSSIQGGKIKQKVQ